MKPIFILILFLSIQTYLFSQENLETFKPTSSFTPDLSYKSEEEIIIQNELLKKTKLTSSEQKELNQLLKKYGEVVESIWDILDGGCSWYCGGGNYKVIASSQLDATKTNNYSASSANDLNYKTSWIPKSNNHGIGDFIEYYFENKSPRITSIIISNGYQKSDIAWKNNNRVKSLKLTINNVDFGILELSDTKTNQEFKVGTFGHNEDGTDLILKFEILEIYNGDKYKDTAITEIYFDGIDVH